MRLIFVLVTLMLSTGDLYAHDNWISRGAYKNPAGEWCCGNIDCHSYQETEENGTGWIVTNTDNMRKTLAGWRNVPDREFIPYEDATMPLAPPDGRLTVCRRHDGSKRCVFGLKPGG